MTFSNFWFILEFLRAISRAFYLVLIGDNPEKLTCQSWITYLKNRYLDHQIDFYLSLLIKIKSTIDTNSYTTI